MLRLLVKAPWQGTLGAAPYPSPLWAWECGLSASESVTARFDAAPDFRQQPTADFQSIFDPLEQHATLAAGIFLQAAHRVHRYQSISMNA